MNKTYTYTKKQVLEILDISPAKLEAKIRSGELTRVRKDPSNARSAWLYSAEELGQTVNDTVEVSERPKWYKKLLFIR